MDTYIVPKLSTFCNYPHMSTCNYPRKIDKRISLFTNHVEKHDEISNKNIWLWHRTCRNIDIHVWSPMRFHDCLCIHYLHEIALIIFIRIFLSRWSNLTCCKSYEYFPVWSPMRFHDYFYIHYFHNMALIIFMSIFFVTMIELKCGKSYEYFHVLGS